MRNEVVYYDRNEVIIVIIQKVTHFPPRLQTTSAGFKESYLEILNIFRHVWHMLRNLIYFLSPRDEDRIMLMFKGESKFILDVSTKQFWVTFYLNENHKNTQYLNPGVILIKSILNYIEYSPVMFQFLHDLKKQYVDNVINLQSYRLHITIHDTNQTWSLSYFPVIKYPCRNKLWVLLSTCTPNSA